MFKVFTEAALPKLSQTPLYAKMNETANISDAIKTELKQDNVMKYKVPIDSIQDIVALMKLNGDSSIKKALKALELNEIVLIFHKDNKNIPGNLPFIVIGDKSNGMSKAFIFVDKISTNPNSQREYPNLMATIEAAYFALMLNNNNNKFISNRMLMQVMCNIYAIMVTLPLEQKFYMKGDYLTKAMLYAIAYFYRMIDGPDHVNASSIPYRKIVSDKVSDAMVKEVFQQVASMEDGSFMGLIKLIKNINPVRFKDLDAMYLQSFVTSCGMPIMFGLENLGYIFLLIYSAIYKTQLTQFGLNKTISALAKKATTLLISE